MVELVSKLTSKLIDVLKLTPRDILFFVFLSISISSSVSMQMRIQDIENARAVSLYARGSSVLETFVKQDIVEPDDISMFLSTRPSGKNDIVDALNNDAVCDELLKKYHDYARNAIMALGL